MEHLRVGEPSPEDPVQAEDRALEALAGGALAPLPPQHHHLAVRGLVQVAPLADIDRGERRWRVPGTAPAVPAVVLVLRRPAGVLFRIGARTPSAHALRVGTVLVPKQRSHRKAMRYIAGG